MKTRLVILLLFLVSGSACAKIYKCVEKEKVLYSNTPCPAGAASTTLSDEPNVAAAIGATPPKAQSSDALSPDMRLSVPSDLSAPVPLPAGVSPDMMSNLKKQLELLLQQRASGTTSVEMADREKVLEGY